MIITNGNSLKTRYLNVNNIDIDKLANDIRNGKIVVMPTDTVYGIMAIHNDFKAINKIYSIKQRSKEKPFIILVSGIEMATKIANIRKSDKNKISELWQEGNSPTTVILKRLDSTTETIALRKPNYQILLELITKLNVPLVSTSANLSGKNILQNFDEIKTTFNGKVEIIVDGPTQSSKPSTIIDFANNHIIRS
ncbi:MAG: threonylcarbamoyl-AMP synthase [Alphaproteobacteria bacterium]|nr:threonylcarbamoyl-AMP synthase [Alphaproteobacteria bacterium]